MKKHLSWKAWTGIRLALVIGILGGGALLIRSELAEGAEVDRAITQQMELAALRMQEGELARRFREIEEPKLLQVEAKIWESLPVEAHDFKTFCIGEAEAETIDLSTLRCERSSTETHRSTRGERASGMSAGQTTSPGEWQEIPFAIRGRGSYGGVLRFCDRIYSGKTLVSIDRFGMSRSSLFGKIFPEGRIPDLADEGAGEGHSFVLEGRVFLHGAPREQEEGR